MEIDNNLWKGIALRPIDTCLKECPRVLYICTWYKKGDGLSKGLSTQIQLEKTPKNYTVVALRVWEHEPGLNILEYNSSEVRKMLKTEFDLIHYFLGTPSNILNKVVNDMKAVGVRLPVLCTICQSPSYKKLLITPYELCHIDHFVFIDKTSYNDPLISFIPENRRSQIYLLQLGITDRITETFPIKKPEKNRVIFGRGTTLSKCPKNMFDVWDRINVPGKELHIAGVPKDGNWVQKEAEKRKNVVFHGFLPYEKWIEVCNSWDIVIYHLPKSTHASLDGNLGLGMLLRKPTIFMGGGAGIERFNHGKNGFVAENEDELVEYAELLASDPDLRLRIGLEARRTTVEIMKNSQRYEKYDYLYRKLMNSPIPAPIRIPLSYRFFFLRNSWRRIIKSWLGIRNKKDLMFWKPKRPDA